MQIVICQGFSAENMCIRIHLYYLFQWSFTSSFTKEIKNRKSANNEKIWITGDWKVIFWQCFDFQRVFLCCEMWNGWNADASVGKFGMHFLFVLFYFCFTLAYDYFRSSYMYDWADDTVFPCKESCIQIPGVAVVPFGEAVYPRCLVPRIGPNTKAPVALQNQNCFLRS